MTFTKKKIGLGIAALALSSVAITSAVYAKKGHGPRAEMMFERMDTNGDQAVTLQEAQAFATARFARMDGNGDGVVDRAERKQARQGRRAERFTRLDTNGDGLVSKDEMTAQLGARAERRFAKLDQNADGFISSDEAAQAKGHRGGGKKAGKHRRGGQAKGPVTLQDAQSRAAERFARVDADQNGVLTLEEVKNAPRKKRGH